MLDIATIKAEVAVLAERNGAAFALLFGSYARGTATERSDVDLIIVQETEAPFLRRLDAYYEALAGRIEAAVEILVYTPAEFAAIRSRPFIRQALSEGIVLYESGKVQP